MEEENRRILEFAKEQQSREEERMEKRKQAEEAMNKVQERVSICDGSYLMRWW
jgi:hypothetical protein